MSTAEPQNTYHVQVGMAKYTVSCGNENEAVQLAKDQLSQQMPHLGTIIAGIKEKEFRVDQIDCLG